MTENHKLYIFVALKSSAQESYIVPLIANEIQCRDLVSPRWDNEKKKKEILFRTSKCDVIVRS